MPYAVTPGASDTPLHPITGQPLRPIFVSQRTGRVYWPILGASEDGAEAAQTGTDTADGSTDSGKAAGGTSSATDTAKTDTTDTSAEVARLQKELDQARAEAGKSRVNAKQAAADEARNAVMKTISEALGLSEGEKLDPAKLAEQVAARDAELTTMRVERAAEKEARAQGADIDALMDSRRFAEQIADLDPADDKFTQTLAAIVKKALADNPKLKAAQAAAASSVDHGGTGGERTSKQPRPLAAAVSGHYGTGAA